MNWAYTPQLQTTHPVLGVGLAGPGEAPAKPMPVPS